MQSLAVKVEYPYIVKVQRVERDRTLRSWCPRGKRCINETGENCIEWLVTPLLKWRGRVVSATASTQMRHVPFGGGFTRCKPLIGSHDI